MISRFDLIFSLSDVCAAVPTNSLLSPLILTHLKLPSHADRITTRNEVKKYLSREFSVTTNWYADSTLTDKVHLSIIVSMLRKVSPGTKLGDIVSFGQLHQFVQSALKTRFNVDTSTMNAFDMVSLFCRYKIYETRVLFEIYKYSIEVDDP